MIVLIVRVSRRDRFEQSGQTLGKHCPEKVARTTTVLLKETRWLVYRDGSGLGTKFVARVGDKSPSDRTCCSEKDER